MEFNEINLEVKNCDVKACVDSEHVTVNFDGIDFESIIMLSSESVNDIEGFFNELFELIVSKKIKPNFIAVPNGTVLYDKIVEDIVSYLNSEINESMDDIKKIINLNEIIN